MQPTPPPEALRRATHQDDPLRSRLQRARALVFCSEALMEPVPEANMAVTEAAPTEAEMQATMEAETDAETEAETGAETGAETEAGVAVASAPRHSDRKPYVAPKRPSF